MSAQRPIDDNEFVRLVWEYYRQNGRDMPWRRDLRPYAIFVSEMMLQQTQVPRVVAKFGRFIDRFPGFSELAAAPFRDVLAEWSGLGYNRRARYLHDAATIVAGLPGGLPDSPEELRALPGIGAGTAGSVAAFAFNKPVVFIETNIRRVYLHHFFPGESAVHDRLLLPLVERHLDRDNPREWYWALMDYGTSIAKGGNDNVRSRHYTRQSRFDRSDRQLRGRILRLLAQRESVVAEELPAYTGFPAERVETALRDLEKERLVAIGGDGRTVRAAD